MQGLVALHGGEVVIRSQVGAGTRITVRLPLDCEAARPAPRQPARIVTRVPAEPVQSSAVGDLPAVKKSA